MKEIKRLLACFSYFTRIPTWKITDLSSMDMRGTTRYFPLVGIFVGAFSAFILYITAWLLPFPIALLLSMASSILLTGAIHEDGFADSCDGFGGGYTKERILEIMKDSSTGVFGAIGLIIMLALKFMALLYMPKEIIITVIIAAHSISRWTSISFLFTHDYARSEDTSKSTVFVRKMPWEEFVLMSFFALLPFLFLETDIIAYSLLLIFPIFLTKTLMGVYFKSQIGGYTGDCMGATQQLAELFFYFGILIIINHLL